MRLSNTMMEALINARLNGSASYGKQTAIALINRGLVFIRQGTDSDIQLTEAGVQIAEKLYWDSQSNCYCTKKTKDHMWSKSYKETLQAEAKKTEELKQFIHFWSNHDLPQQILQN